MTEAELILWLDPDEDDGNWTRVPPESSGSLTDLQWLTEPKRPWFPLLPPLDPDDGERSDARLINPPSYSSSSDSSADGARRGPRPSGERPPPLEHHHHPPKDNNNDNDDDEERNGRPPFSYVDLIFMAIHSAPDKRMTCREIYAWIERHFDYYRDTPLEWKASIRHKLSCTAVFVRDVDTPHAGSWSVDLSRNHIHDCRSSKKSVPEHTLGKYATWDASAIRESGEQIGVRPNPSSSRGTESRGNSSQAGRTNSVYYLENGATPVTAFETVVMTENDFAASTLAAELCPREFISEEIVSGDFQG